MKIDYTKPLTRKAIDIESYNAKFEKADQFLASDNPDEEVLRELLLDPTTFIYLNFRINGEPFKLYPYQDLIINDQWRFKYFSAANQIGKSALLEAKAARNLIIDHGFGHAEAIVSQNLSVSTDRMRNIKSLLNTSQTFDWKEEKGDADNMSVLTFDIKDDEGKIKYTNKLILAPCSAGLLSYALHELNLDEFEFWEIDVKHFFNQIAEPRTYKTKGNITIFSNPNGADNFGAELEELILPKGGKKFHTYRFNFLDCPGNTEDDLEIAKVGKTRAVIESTLLSIRSLSDRNFFSPDEIERSYDKEVNELKMVGKQPFFFMDVGAKHDQSVLVGGYVEVDKDEFVHVHIPIIKCYPVGYPLSRVVGTEVDDSDGWHYEKSVKEYLDEWSVDGIIPIFGVDVTGNSGIVPLFETVGIFPIDVTFSGPVKSGMYQRFKYFMEKGLLHRCKSEEFDYQASHLEMKKSIRGYLMIHHFNEGDLDDVMDSVAGLIHLADNPEYVEPSMELLTEDDNDKPVQGQVL